VTKTKWIADTKIARKVHEGRITEYRLNQKTEKFELKIEYDDGKKGFIISDDITWTVPKSGLYSMGTTMIFDEHIPYIDQDTCATKDEKGDIIFAKKEVE